MIHTKLDGAIQLQHLIRHLAILANPMNYTAYIALGWVYLLILKEVIAHTGAINGWNVNVAFIPASIGVVALCSCDSTDAHMGNFDFVLLYLTYTDTLCRESEQKSYCSRFHLKHNSDNI